MVTTSWCGPTALPRHGPIGVVPRSGGFPALQPRRHLLGSSVLIHKQCIKQRFIQDHLLLRNSPACRGTC